MGEVLTAVLLLIGAGAVVVVVAQQIDNGRRRRALSSLPTAVLSRGDDTEAYLAQAKRNFRLAQQSVRILERLLARDEAVPFLSAQERQEISRIVAEFYEEN